VGEKTSLRWNLAPSKHGKGHLRVKGGRPSTKDIKRREREDENGYSGRGTARILNHCKSGKEKTAKSSKHLTSKKRPGKAGLKTRSPAKKFGL